MAGESKDRFWYLYSYLHGRGAAAGARAEEYTRVRALWEQQGRPSDILFFLVQNCEGWPVTRPPAAGGSPQPPVE
jgi:hypothetical protein